MPPTVTIFVLSHDGELLARAPERKELVKTLLTDLDIGEFQSNQLGECRAFLQDFSAVDSEYIGFANARWDQKYFRLHTRLHSLVTETERHAAPGWVLAPWPAQLV